MWYGKVRQGKVREAKVECCMVPVMFVRSEKSKRRTKTVAGTLEPKWNQSFIYAPMKRNDIKTQSLQMTVYDYDRIGSGEYVGEVRTPIHSYITRYSVRNGNVMVMSICIAPVREASLRRSGIARIVKGCHSFTCTARPAFRPQAE